MARLIVSCLKERLSVSGIENETEMKVEDSVMHVALLFVLQLYFLRRNNNHNIIVCQNKDSFYLNLFINKGSFFNNQNILYTDLETLYVYVKIEMKFHQMD